MIQLYLPIAGMSVDAVLLLALGGIVGVLSGVFGVGGGFLITPLLIFIGVPPAIAVASSANQLVGGSISGVIAYWRRGSVDFKMGAYLIAGGFAGSAAGVWVFGVLRRLGQVDLAINLSYVVLLATLGSLMLVESVRTMLRRRRPNSARRKLHQHTWLHGLPWKTRFQRSRLYISACMPVALGAGIGVLSAILGVGGGFALVPAMIYLLGMPAVVVPGTSLFQSIFVAASVTLLQAYENHTVDVVLALLLLVGGTIGAQIGARIGTHLRGEQLRALLALIVLSVAGKIVSDLVVAPDEPYSLVPLPGSY